MLTAVIQEMDCVGCAKCLPACPVDAIIGAAGFLHTVITHECIGCGLCVAPCPMDCIALIPSPTPDSSLKAARAQKAKERYIAKQKRRIVNALPAIPAKLDPSDRANMQKEIQASILRVEEKRKSHGS